VAFSAQDVTGCAVTDESEDERYLLIGGRRWRKADPAIPPRLASELVAELMDARRAVGAAKRDGDETAERKARSRVHDAKLALGERGQAWWLPATSETRTLRLAATIRTLLRKRGADKTICPSDAARVCGGDDWRDLMDDTRTVAWGLAEQGWLEVTQRGAMVEPPVTGAVRLRRKTS